LPNSDSMVRHSNATALSCLVFLFALMTSAKSESLREWVEQNIFARTSTGVDVVALRTRPIRALVRVEDPELADLTRNAIADFSKALDLQYEFATERINMVVVATYDVINDQAGGPNKKLITSLGISARDADHIASSVDWSSSNCAFVIYPHQDAIIGLSIAAASKTLEKKNLEACLMSLVASSFGFRSQATQGLKTPTDILPYLRLARSMRECVNQTGKMPENEIDRQLLVGCVTKMLEAGKRN
jgi:hypothetical protein